jgi:nickel/cobalt transporter (NicO) family protein
VSRPTRPRGAWRARAGALALLAAAILAGWAAPAAAHPLGNFTVNASSGLRVGPDRLVVDYVVDLAEIPAFQARQAIDGDHDGRVAAAEAARWRGRECLRLAGGLRVTLDGLARPLAVTGSSLRFPEGVGGLATLRLECALAAPLPARPGASDLAYADANHQGRVGWREITAAGDRATLDATDVPPVSPSDRLTAYPADRLGSPLDQRTATIRFRPGGPSSSAGGPRASAAGDAPGAGAAAVSRGGVDRATVAFTALVGERAGSAGFAVVALGLAVALGAAHALAPGHGKTVMAAYLVGLRGTPRQAATIGATVTLTHTAGVLVLGLVLSTTRAVAPERLYPWFGLGSGLLLAAVGAALLGRALTSHRRHVQLHRRPHHHGHRHHDHGHHDHAGPAGRPLGRRGLVVLGLAGGLVPSPSAVVVLLGGIALGQAWFGVALVVAYGLGMAATLTGVGLLLAHLRTRMDRRLRLPAGSRLARLGRLLPAVTASVIVVVGLALAASGAAQL